MLCREKEIFLLEIDLTARQPLIQLSKAPKPAAFRILVLNQPFCRYIFYCNDEEKPSFLDRSTYELILMLLTTQGMSPQR